MDPRGPPGPIPAAAWPIDDVVRLQVCGRHGFRPRRFQEHEAHPSRAEFLKHNTLCGSVVIKHAKGVIMIADILTKAQARPIFLQLLKLLDDYSKNSIIELTN